MLNVACYHPCPTLLFLLLSREFIRRVWIIPYGFRIKHSKRRPRSGLFRKKLVIHFQSREDDSFLHTTHWILNSAGTLGKVWFSSMHTVRNQWKFDPLKHFWELVNMLLLTCVGAVFQRFQSQWSVWKREGQVMTLLLGNTANKHSGSFMFFCICWKTLPNSLSCTSLYLFWVWKSTN